MSNNKPERKARETETARVADIAITHPDKVWWLEEGITKMEACQYYNDVAPRLLPWLSNRLLTFERCPDGIGGACFFEKNFVKGIPNAVQTLPVPTDGSGKMVHYVVGGSRQSLLSLVNLGCIAVHVMNCEVGSLDKPDWLAFDLDPSSGLFADAVKAADILRKLLEQMKIQSFPKTTGGRGLHVLVPLQHGPTQKQVRLFAYSLGQEMARMSPRLITMEMRKANRQGRVLVDWLRNAFGQTIAAPYSVRCREGAPVSTPLGWDEVGTELNPLHFNIRTIGRRLEAKDPWIDFWQQPQKLPVNAGGFPESKDVQPLPRIGKLRN